MQVFSFEQSKAVTDDSTQTHTHTVHIDVYANMSACCERVHRNTHTLSSPGCGGWHLTPEGPAGLSRRLNGELSSFTNPAAHIPHSHPPSLSKTLQHTDTHAHTNTLSSLPSFGHPSILCSGCSFSPLLCPSCSEWASRLLPPSLFHSLSPSLSTCPVKDFKAKVRWSLTVTNRSNPRAPPSSLSLGWGHRMQADINGDDKLGRKKSNEITCLLCASEPFRADLRTRKKFQKTQETRAGLVT